MLIVILIILILYFAFYYVLYASIHVNTDVYSSYDDPYVPVKVVDKTFFRVTLSDFKEMWDISLIEFLMKYKKY